jgi:hypothetical protein
MDPATKLYESLLENISIVEEKIVHLAQYQNSESKKEQRYYKELLFFVSQLKTTALLYGFYSI